MATNEIKNGCGSSIEAVLASNQKRRRVEGFEFGEMARRTHQNVLAEMLKKCSPTISLRLSGCGKSFQRPNRWSGPRLN